jgi:MMPL family
VHELRDHVIPQATAGTGLVVHVGGPNAGTVDFADAVGVRLPWLIAVVICLSLLLLVVLVRSLTIALKAAAMTLLSVGASYGILTAIVQWGWGGRALGFPAAMPITTWVPLFIFPILFGLSTDYEVFLISRIREEYDGGADTREAVARGLAHTSASLTRAIASGHRHARTPTGQRRRSPTGLTALITSWRKSLHPQRADVLTVLDRVLAERAHHRKANLSMQRHRRVIGHGYAREDDVNRLAGQAIEQRAIQQETHSVASATDI